MSSLYAGSASPHAHDASATHRIMLQVCLALTPATLWGFYIFGYAAIITFSLCCLTAVASEYLCLRIMHRPTQQVWDGSALLTGWLLGLSLPSLAPWWLSVGGAACAIILGKHIYGGLGQNVFNPAMLARTLLLISFPVQMTTWAVPVPLTDPNSLSFLSALGVIMGTEPLTDGMTGATLLGGLKSGLSAGLSVDAYLAEQNYGLLSNATGFAYGSLGETSSLLILLGGLLLLTRRIIEWYIPVAMLVTLALMAQVSHWANPERYAGALFHLTSGGAMLGAFFIATDYVTSPNSTLGKLIFGAGCGLITFIIRAWGGFPEAVAFAVLFMNSVTPLIDLAFKPRFYGRTTGGDPLKKKAAKRV